MEKNGDNGVLCVDKWSGSGLIYKACMRLSLQGLSMRQIRFRFDGQPINETDTPSQVSVESWNNEFSYPKHTGECSYNVLVLPFLTSTMLNTWWKLCNYSAHTTQNLSSVWKHLDKCNWGYTGTQRYNKTIKKLNIQEITPQCVVWKSVGGNQTHSRSMCKLRTC